MPETEADVTYRVQTLSGQIKDACTCENPGCRKYLATAATSLAALLAPAPAPAAEGDETIGYEWATETPDGTRSYAEDEEWARDRAARKLQNHGVTLKVVRREIRHFVGRWDEAPTAESEA